MTTHHTKRFLTEDGALKHNMKGKNASLESAEVPDDWLLFRDASKGQFHAFSDALEFYNYWRMDAVVGEKPQLHAWVGNKPRRAFIDVDMDAKDLKDADCRATDVTDAVEDAIFYVLSIYYGYDDEPVVRRTTCNRADKWSTHFRLELVLASKWEHTHFLTLVQGELPEAMRQFIDTGATMALRLPNCYKTDKTSGKMVKTVWTTAEGFVPTFRDGLINYTQGLQVLPKIAPKKARTINKTKHYSEEQMAQIVAICDAREELKNHVYTGSSDRTGFLYYQRVTAGYCMMCRRDHESDGAYVSVSNRQWFINCWRKSKVGDSYIRMGNILSKKEKHEFNTKQFLADIMADEVKVNAPDRANVGEVDNEAAVEDAKDVIVAEDAPERNWEWYDWTKFCSGEIDASEAPAYFKETCFHTTGGGVHRLFTKNYDPDDGSLYYVEASPKLFNVENNFEVGSVRSKSRIMFNDLFQESYRANTFKKFVLTPYLHTDPTSDSTFNKWCGFRFTYVEQKEIHIDAPILSRVIRHIRDIICSKDAKLFEYVLKWIAHIFQSPANRCGVAVLLKSTKQGTGKNSLTDFLQAVLGGKHSMQTDDLKSLVGDFNSQLESKLLIVCDEVGNYAHHTVAERMKSLITRKEIFINPKGITGYTLADHSRYIFTSNSAVPLRIDNHDRRYLPIDVSDAMVGNREYFNALHKDLKNVEVQRAFFNLVSNLDLTGWEPRDIPETALKQELIEINLGSTSRYLIDWAKGDRPEFEYDDTGVMRCHVVSVFEDYTRWMENNREHKIQSNRIFSRELKDNGVEKKNRKVEGVQTKVWMFTKQGMQERIRVLLKNKEFTL